MLTLPHYKRLFILLVVLGGCLSGTLPLSAQSADGSSVQFIQTRQIETHLQWMIDWMRILQHDDGTRLLFATGCQERWPDSGQCHNQEIGIWDMKTGQQIGESVSLASGQNTSLGYIGLDPTGNMLITFDKGSSEIQFWRLDETLRFQKNGSAIPINSQYADINSLDMSLDGTRLAVAGGRPAPLSLDTLEKRPTEGFVVFWTLADNLPEPITLHYRLAEVTKIAFNPTNPEELAVAMCIESAGALCKHGQVRFFDLHSGDLNQHPPIDQPIDITDLTFSPDGQSLIIIGSDGSVSFREVSSGKQIAQFLNSSGKSVKFSPDGHYLFLEGSTISVWDINAWKQTGEPVSVDLFGTPLFGHAMTLSPDGTLLAIDTPTTSKTRTINIWERNNQTLSCDSRVRIADKPPIGLAMTAEDRIVTLRSDSAVGVWEVDVKGCLMGSFSPAPLENTVATSLALHPDGNRLAIGTEAGQVQWWDLQADSLTGQIFSLPEYDPVRSLAISPEGQWLAVGGQSGTITLWDLAKGELIASLKDHTEVVRVLAFSVDPAGALRLASGSDDMSVRLWDIATPAPIAKLTGFRGPVTTLAFSPDGTTLAVGSTDTMIRFWDIHDPVSIVERVDQHHSVGDKVYSIAFSPDGNSLLSIDYDRRSSSYSILLFNPNNMTFEPHRLGSSKGYIVSVAFSSDGRKVITIDQEGSLAYWLIQ